MSKRVLSLVAPIGAGTLLLLILSGCGDGGDTTVIQTVATQTTTQVGTQAGTTATTTPPTSQDVGGSFYSPSRNIGCLISEEHAECAVNDYSYEPPPRPTDCDLEWGRSLGVTAGGSGEFTCIGGLLAEPSSATLDYGRSTSAGEITCESSQAGIRCENGSGHGFLLAREKADAY